MIKNVGTWVFGVAALAWTVLPVSSANALTLTWNTCSGTPCATNSLTPSVMTTSGTGVNQTMTFQALSDPTKLLTAEAFSTTNSFAPYGNVIKTSIAIFGGGLGAGGESVPQHAVDNVGPDEFIIFQFAQDTYIPKSFKIGYMNTDSDIVTYIGGTLGGSNDILAQILLGTFSWDTFISNPAALGFVSQTFLDVPIGTDQNFSNGASGRYLIIGARNETDTCGTTAPTPCDGGEDMFKIEQIVGVVNTPEPGTLLLLITGMAGLVGFARRRA